MQRRPHARSAFRRCQTGNAKPCRTEVPVPTAIGVADREAPSRASIPSSRRLVAIATISSAMGFTDLGPMACNTDHFGLYWPKF